MADLVAYRKPARDTQPDYLHTAYGSTVQRAPQQPPIELPPTLTELTGPQWRAHAHAHTASFGPHASDLTAGHPGEPLGERIIVAGRVLDEGGRPVTNSLVEVWQCNAAGRYRHARDQHDAPLDPNFVGSGRVLTDDEGRYRFKTIRPGAYPWRNHYNAWRPAHIHFSLFGPAWSTRLVTQMYFPGDPLLGFDPIFHSIPDPQARERLVSSLDWELTQSEYALGYRFDIVLRGRLETPREGLR